MQQKLRTVDDVNDDRPATGDIHENWSPSSRSTTRADTLDGVMGNTLKVGELGRGWRRMMI